MDISAGTTVKQETNRWTILKRQFQVSDILTIPAGFLINSELKYSLVHLLMWILYQSEFYT